MDEPFGALDAITKRELHAEFQRIRTNNSAPSAALGSSAPSAALASSAPFAAILVTHDIAEAFTLADRVAVLHDGRIAAVGTPAELRRSTDPRVSTLVVGA
jgi:osmoprotectant transport system ATP-binding protein